MSREPGPPSQPAAPPGQPTQSAATRLQLQRQRLAEQRSRLLAGQTVPAGTDARSTSQNTPPLFPARPVPMGGPPAGLPPPRIFSASPSGPSMGAPVAAATPPQLPVGVTRASSAALVPSQTASGPPPPLPPGAARGLSDSLSRAQSSGDVGFTPPLGHAEASTGSKPAAEAGTPSDTTPGPPPLLPRIGSQKQGSAGFPLPRTPEHSLPPPLKVRPPQANGMAHKGVLQPPSTTPINWTAPGAAGPPVHGGETQEAHAGGGVSSPSQGDSPPNVPVLAPSLSPETSGSGTRAGELTSNSAGLGTDSQQAGPFSAAAAAAPPFNSTALDDDTSFFSEYGDGFEQQTGDTHSAALPVVEALGQLEPAHVPAQPAGGESQPSSTEATWLSAAGGVSQAQPVEPGVATWQTETGYGELVEPTYEAAGMSPYDSLEAWPAEAAPPSSAPPQDNYSGTHGAEPAAEYRTEWPTAAYNGTAYSTNNGSAVQYGEPSPWSGEASQSAHGGGFEQASYSQEGYGQQGVYGQAAYGQSAYGQAAHGEAAYGQPDYGQAAYGQLAHGEAAYGQPAYGQAAYGQTAHGEAAFGQPTYGQAAPGEAAYGQVPYGQAAYGQAAYGQAAYGQAAYGESAYGQAVYGQAAGYNQLGYGQGPHAVQWTPRSPDEAMRIPYGRPPIALLSFGIGGRVALMVPQSSGAAPTGEGGSQNGTVQLVQLGGLPRLLHQHAGDVPVPTGRPRDRTGDLLREFPGPLLPSTNKAKVVGYIRERELKVMEEEEGARSPDMLACMWGLLRVMALNDGRLRPGPPPSKAKPGEPIEVQVAGVLTAVDPTSHAVVPEPWRGPAPSHHLPQLATEVQRLLLLGNRDEALQVATQGGLWGPALVIAYQQGPAAFAQAAGSMLSTCLLENSPLHTALSMMAGASDSLFPISGSVEAGYRAGLGEEQAGLAHWRSHLAVLGSNPTPGDEAVLFRLGDRLWAEANEAAAAQVCYLLAGQRPEPYSREARLCALGWDHRFSPRAWGHPACLQRTQVLEWAAPPGPGGGWVTGMAYKLVYAVQLAEQGFVERALQYCKLLLDSINAVGRPPASLLICRAAALDIQDRLKQHALGHNIRVNPVPGGTLISSVGRWIDKGINKLIGGDLVGPPSTGSEPDSRSPATDGRPYPQVGSQGGSTGKPSPAEVVAQTEVSGGGRSSVPHSGERSNSGRTNSTISLSGMLGRVGGLLSAIPAPAPRKETQIGEENTFYFDEETKQWRERGVVDPAAPDPLPPPPPTTFMEAPLGTVLGPPSVPGGQGSFSSGRLKRTGTQSRYVNTMPSPQSPVTTMAERNWGLNVTPSSHIGVARDGAPSFFVPGSQQTPAGPFLSTGSEASSTDQPPAGGWSSAWGPADRASPSSSGKPADGGMTDVQL
eukprot:jgi/Botrbrau1/2851/Bobra.0036s0001.1